MGGKFEDGSKKFPKLNLSQAIDFSLFPGVQSALLPEHIAAKAVSFEEAKDADFKIYAHKVIENARTLAEYLIQNGIYVLTGGTDSHQVIIDVSKIGLTGYAAQKALEEVGIIQNRNMLPYDTKSPFITSGIRFGTSVSTTIGLNAEQHSVIAKIVAEVLNSTKLISDKKYKLDEEVKIINLKKISQLLNNSNHY
jgi:glycine hydroxymethyltransferase